MTPSPRAIALLCDPIEDCMDWSFSMLASLSTLCDCDMGTARGRNFLSIDGTEILNLEDMEATPLCPRKVEFVKHIGHTLYRAGGEKAMSAVMEEFADMLQREGRRHAINDTRVIRMQWVGIGEWAA